MRWPAFGDAMRRRELIAPPGGAEAAWLLIQHSQRKMPQIGVLSLGRGDKSDVSLGTLKAFTPALGELGHVEGQNIAFDWRFADGDPDKLTRLAQELVGRRVDAIVVHATTAAPDLKEVRPRRGPRCLLRS